MKELHKKSANTIVQTTYFATIICQKIGISSCFISTCLQSLIKQGIFIFLIIQTTASLANNN
jgi:hypothetical protein